MTGVPGAIGVGVAGTTTAAAFAQYMGRYAFAQAFIKHKILSNETRFQSPLLYFSCISNDAAMQLVHVFKTMVAQPGAGLFAAHSSGAIQENLLVLFLLQFVDHQFYFFPKSVGGGTPGVDKVTDFAFVGIAHVHHHYILLLREFVKFKGREVGAYVGGIEYAIVETVGHNFRTHPYNQLQKGLSLIFNGPFERHVTQFGYRVHIRSEEHTSELQSRPHLVCRLLLEKKKY